MAGIRDIRKAGKDKQQVRIEYTNRDGKSITRTIRPYEVKGKYLYATDNIHGAAHIHSFRVSRIRSVTPVDRKFRPKWDVKL